MTGERKKTKGKFSRTFIAAAVLAAICLSQIPLLPAKKALAVDDDMSKVFPPSLNPVDVGTGLPANIPTNTPYSGYERQDVIGTDKTEYVVNPIYLKIEPNTNKQNTANNAFFYLTIKLGGQQQAAVDVNPVDGKYNSDEEIGSWQSLYDYNSNGTLPLTQDAGEGIWLEIGRGVALHAPITEPQGTFFPTATTFQSPPIAPVLTSERSTTDTTAPLYTLIPLNGVIDFKATYQKIPITVGATSGLVANTDYYARLVIAEDYSTSQAYSNIIPFKTGTATTAQDGGGQNVVAVAVTAGESVVTQTDNAGLILSVIACEWTSPTTWFTGCIVYLFYYIFYIPSTWILMAAGWLLDVATVFSISTHIYQDPTFISEGWRIVRDISNIFFILILIYLAFKLILGNSGSDVKKMISTIILVAVLLNFSLFFTKVVIDASNILARIFYTQITITGSDRTPVSNSSTLGIEEKSLSQALADGFNVNKMMSEDTIQKMNSEYGSTSDKFARAGYGFLIILLALIVNLVAAWSFFIVALLFVGRVVALWVAMIFSAFAFTSKAVPWLDKVKEISWTSWLQNLFSVSFLAPIFLFFIYIIIAFVNSRFLDGLFNNVANFSFTSLMIAILMQFVILITLVQKSKDMAQSMAGDTAGALAKGLQKGISTVGSAVAGAGLAVATGGAGLALRGTLGRYASQKMADEGYKSRMAAKIEKGGIGGWYARQQLKSFEGLGKASFDARGSKGFQGALGKIGGATGFNINAGKAQEGGFVGAKEKETEKKMQLAELLKSKKTDDEYLEALPDTDERKKRYLEDKKNYDEKKKQYDDYDKDYKEKYETAKSQPNFDEAAWKAQYEATNGKKPEEPKAPKASSYVSVAEENKARMAAYAKYLREGTIRAGIERRTGAGEVVGVGRSAETEAAKRLEKEIKGTQKSKESIEKLTRAEEEAAAAVKRMQKKIDDFNAKYKGTPEEIENQINAEVAAKRGELSTIDQEAELLRQKYEKMKDKTGKAGQNAYMEWKNKESMKEEKKAEIDALKNAVKDHEQRVSAKEKKEEHLEKIREKIANAGKGGGGDKKKDDKKDDSKK